MTYTHFILVGIDVKLGEKCDKFANKIKKCYDELRKDDDEYPIIGETEDGLYETDVMINKFKKLTTNFPEITFTFNIFVTCGGGCYGIFIILKNKKLIANFDKVFDGTFIKIKNGDHVIKVGTDFKCDSTYIENNITIFFNDEYGYEY
jgi:hypothetical protein